MCHHQVEEARSIWGGGDAVQSISMLKDAITCYRERGISGGAKGPGVTSSDRRGVILAKILVGSWLAKSKAEGYSTIHETYLESALEDVDTGNDTDPELQGEVIGDLFVA